MQKIYPCLHLQIYFSEIQQNIEFFYVFLQKLSINLEKIPLTIQIFCSQRTPNVFVISTNEKKIIALS